MCCVLVADERHVRGINGFEAKQIVEARSAAVAESRRRLQRHARVDRDRFRPRQSAAEHQHMTVTIAGIEFDHHHYDPGGDVLYLCVGAPRESGHGLETPEGHAVEYDAAWNVVGLT